MTILGLPVSTFIAFIIPIIVIAITFITFLTGTYEGKKIEEEYDVDEWYRTF